MATNLSTRVLNHIQVASVASSSVSTRVNLEIDRTLAKMLGLKSVRPVRMA